MVLVVAGCGGHQRGGGGGESGLFDCKERLASYVVSHHMGGDELGVQMDCQESGPRIKRWRTDKQGVRQEDAHFLSPAEFDGVWKEIDGTGWPNLKDCGNGTTGARDPVYVFDIKDDQNKATFQCQSQSMPYPYNTIVDPLDVAAQKGRNQLGDDEPGDLKALDKKKPKK
jgi:hypothetical protein